MNNKNETGAILSLQGAKTCQIINLSNENRTGVLEIKNPTDWYIAHCDLSAYKNQYVTIKFSTEIKRMGASGDLVWNINNERYPSVGNMIKKAKTDTWYKMNGMWKGVLSAENPEFYLNTWKNNSESTTYYIDNFTAHITVHPEGKPAAQAHKPLSEMAKYLKNLIPAAIPDNYSLKPLFLTLSDEESIRNGVVAFKDFIILLYDRLIADGHTYEKLKTKSKTDSHPNLITGYPFIHHVKSILINIGYQGALTIKGDAIMLDDISSLSVAIGSEGEQMSTKISGPKLIEVLRFLTTCGVCFEELDLDCAKPNLSNVEMLTVTYPDDAYLLTGLKVMATAQRELKFSHNNDIFLRCDYKALKAEETDITEKLMDFINPLPLTTQKFALSLHQRYLGKGLSCTVKISTMLILFSYMFKKHVVWEFAVSFSSGYRIYIKPKKMENYPDVVKGFNPSLQEKIEEGYGCERRFDEPCDKGCHGYSIPLDDSVLDIGKNIKEWIDYEFFFLTGIKT